MANASGGSQSYRRDGPADLTTLPLNARSLNIALLNPVRSHSEQSPPLVLSKDAILETSARRMLHADRQILSLQPVPSPLTTPGHALVASPGVFVHEVCQDVSLLLPPPKSKPAWQPPGKKNDVSKRYAMPKSAK